MHTNINVGARIIIQGLSVVRKIPDVIISDDEAMDEPDINAFRLWIEALCKKTPAEEERKRIKSKYWNLGEKKRKILLRTQSHCCEVP